MGQKTYHYEGEQYSAASKYGIDGGRIKKLTIKLKGKVIVSYSARSNNSRIGLIDKT